MAKIVTAAEVDIQIKGTESLGELKSKLEAAKNNADQLKEEFGENSEEFKKADSNVKSLSSSMDNLTNEAKELNEKGIKKVNQSSKDMKKGFDNAKDASGKLNGATGNLSNGLGGLGGGFGRAATGAKALGKQFLVLMANPIVLLIAAIAGALVALFKAFTSTKKGGEQFKAVMDGLGAVIDVVRDRVLKVGSAIVKFFTGDWSGALQDAKGAVSGFGDEVAKEFEVARQASLKLAEIKDRMRDLSVERAKQNLEISKARELSMDLTKSNAERLAAVRKAGTLETELETKNVKVLKDKLETIRAINAQSDSGSEALQQEADAEIALYNAQQSAANARLRLQREELRLRNEAKAAAKAQADAAKRARDEAKRAAEADRKEKERIAAQEAQKAAEALAAAQEIEAAAARAKLERETNEFDLRILDLQAKFEKEKAILEAQNLDTLTLEQNFNQELLQVEQDRADKANQIAEQEAAKKKAIDEKAKADAIKSAQEKADAKAAIEQAAYNTAAAFSSLIGELGNENLKVQKAQALIQIGIDTASAISSLVKMSQANPANAFTGGIAGALQFAAGLLQIGTNMAKAASILGGSAPSVPDSNTDVNNATNQINQTEENRQQQFKVFVTETDIANATSKRINLTQVGIVE